MRPSASSSSASSTRCAPTCSRGGRAAATAPTFAELLERGSLIGDCVSAFPSVTPVCCSEIVTGEAPDRHWISGMNWYHRAERRYVEYGTSFEATRAFGLFRTLYDIVYNMNMAHLSHEVETVFETLGDPGVRTRLHAVPHLPRAHAPRARARGPAAPGGGGGQLPPRDLGPGRALLRRAVLEPARSTASRPWRGPAPATSTRPASGASWSPTTSTTSCSSRFPTTTTTPTATGPRRSSSRSPAPTRLRRARRRRRAGSTRSSTEHAVILSPTTRRRGSSTRCRSPRRWLATGAVLEPNEDRPSRPSSRSARSPARARVYVLDEGRRAGARTPACAPGCASSRASTCSPGWRPRRTTAAVDAPSGGASSASAPGRSVADRRGVGWDLDGRPRGPAARRPATAAFDSATPTRTPSRGSGRRSRAARGRHPDLGGARLRAGRLGRHDPLPAAAATARSRAGDSLGPLLLCGLEPGTEAIREQWALARRRRPRPRPLRDRRRRPGAQRRALGGRSPMRLGGPGDDQGAGGRRPAIARSRLEPGARADPPRHPQAGELGAAGQVRRSSAAPATSINLVVFALLVEGLGAAPHRSPRSAPSASR